MFTQHWKQVKRTFTILIVLLMLAGGMGAAPMPVQAVVLPFQSSPAEEQAADETSSGLNVVSLDIPTDRIIIRYKASTEAYLQPTQADQMQRLSQAAGVSLEYYRAMSGDAHVLSLPDRLPLDQVQAIAASLMALPEVEYAEPDQIMYHTGDPAEIHPQPVFSPLLLAPNDPLYPSQWHYYETWGINAPAAWDVTTGSASVVVAVLDTGITNHAEFSGRTVPGYDFITDVWTANDDDGRDSDPSDPGDWVAANACGYTHPARNSSWHGTHVAGTVGAASNNGLGVAGVNWNSKIQTVRVLGRCGGSISDIADGMRWSAGLSVSGVPANSNPAKVLNLSLGGSGSCGTTYQSAIDAITTAGAVVVVSAGNSNADASGFRPANCTGVITVAATKQNGYRAYYSNYGSTVEISAPGGETNVSTSNGVLSTLNTGTQGPDADTYDYYQGTSMAAPHVSGVASLLFSLNPSRTPSQVLQILQNTAKPFPIGGTCTTLNCGSGIVDAGAATTIKLFLPLVMKDYSGVAPPGWVTIVSTDFEGAFPDPWQVSGSSGYQWGKQTCQPYAGSFSGWGVGGGTNGSGLACGSNYPDDADSWMEYGPFSLVGATAGDLKFKLWLDSESDYDFVCRMASINGTDFYGDCDSGNTGGWTDRTMDLTNVYTLGNLMGQPSVWVALIFDSDSLVNYPEGGYVDNIVLRKCPSGGTCPAGSSAVLPGAGKIVETPMQRTSPK